MMDRVAHFVAQAEDAHVPGSSDRWAEVFAQTLRSLEFLPNSPTLMNAGTGLGLLSACVVLPIEDSLDSLSASLRHTALAHQAGAGTGFDFSEVRPAGAPVSTTGGVASGPVSFIRIFDLATGDEAIDGDWGYVAMSRGRHTNHLYMADMSLERSAHGRDPIAPDPAGQAARRLTVTRADTPLADRDVYDATETATRWQQLTVRIAEARKDDYQRRTLTGELDKLTEQRETLAAYYNRDRQRLDEVTSGLSWLSRSSRAERDRIHGALQRYLDRAEQIDQDTAELRGQLQQLGPRPDIDAWQVEADRLRDVLDAVAVQTARRHPHPSLPDPLERRRPATPLRRRARRPRRATP